MTAVIAGATTIIAAAINIFPELIHPDTNQPPPAMIGEILKPVAGQRVLPAPEKVGAEVTLANVPKAHHAWLAVQKDNQLWPTEPEVVGPNWSGDIAVDEIAPGEAFSLALLVVDAETNRDIGRWLRRDPGLRRDSAFAVGTGVRRLDVVVDLIARVPTRSGPPLRCVFPQAGPGQEFRFTGGDAVLTNTFDENRQRAGGPPGRWESVFATTPALRGAAGGACNGAAQPRAASTPASSAPWRSGSRGRKGTRPSQVSVKDRLGQEAWVQARSMLAVSERWQTLRIPLADLKVDDVADREPQHRIQPGTRSGRGVHRRDRVRGRAAAALPHSAHGRDDAVAGPHGDLRKPREGSGRPRLPVRRSRNLDGSPGRRAAHLRVRVPHEPPGGGWYNQHAVATVGADGTWTQTPSYIGNLTFPAKGGDELLMRAAVVTKDAHYQGTALDDLPIGGAIPALERIWRLSSHAARIRRS